MTLRKTLLLTIAAIYSSCSGQTSPQSVNDQTIAGDTVSAISNSVFVIYQDTKNNYWFGSDGEGVYRYDGKHLVHYTTKQGLSNDKVRSIQEDKQGNILVGTANGVSRYDGYALTNLTAINSDQQEGWRLHPGDLWFAGAQDSGILYRYDGTTLFRLRFPKTKAGEDFIAKFPRDKFPNMNFSPYDVYGIYRDKRGNMWFGSNIGLCRYDGKHFAWITEKELGIDAIAIHVRSIIEDRKGHFWFTNTMHRFVVDQQDTSTTVRYRKEPGLSNMDGYDAEAYAYFLSGLEDSNGDLWLVTYNRGIWRYDGKSMRQYLIKSDKGEVATAFSIYKDLAGTLWVGTHAAGAYRFDGKEFVRFIP